MSGELTEAGGFYPNGAREEWLGASDQVFGAQIPLEHVGFTGKEADEEVGLVYFGERYLVPRIGRWATPDPLSIHAMGGGEAGNSYHYVSGNLLQARDPLGLCPDNTSCPQAAPAGSGGMSMPEEAMTSPDGYANPSDNPEKAVLDAHRATTMPNKLATSVAKRVDEVGLKPAIAGEALALLSANFKVFAFSLFATEVHDHKSAKEAAGQLVAGVVAGEVLSIGVRAAGARGANLGKFAEDLRAPSADLTLTDMARREAGRLINGTPRGNPASVTAARNMRSGDLFYGVNGEMTMGEAQAIPQMSQLPAETRTAWSNTANCSEVGACAKLFSKDPHATWSDVEMSTDTPKTMEPKARCSNCVQTTAGSVVYTDP